MASKQQPAKDSNVQFKRRRELKRTRIEIIPMIDTIFFLLVFFMLSSLAMTKLNGLTVNLPKASTATKQPKSLTITITKDKLIYVNAQPVVISALSQLLVEKAGGPSVDLANTSVVLNADYSVPHGLVVNCMDESRKVGITHFAIATTAEDNRERR
jgi:biopolymer transport protein ExbD